MSKPLPRARSANRAQVEPLWRVRAVVDPERLDRAASRARRRTLRQRVLRWLAR